MMKFLLLFVFVFPAFAGTITVETYPHMDPEKGADFLQYHFERENNRIIFTSPHKNLYKKGDFVILWGVGSSTDNQTITRDEYSGLWKVMNFLSDSGYRVIMNVRATGAHLKAAAESATTTVLIFSGHGNTSGFYDWEDKKVDYNVLANASKSVKLFILGACYGRIALDSVYVVPKRIKTHSWEGETDSDELIDFLMSKSWARSVKLLNF